MKKLWRDGRSGEAGCLAGNLVLAHIRDTDQEAFSERKGTTFRGRASIWVGRVCSTDAYLNARDRHWANLSADQHREIMSEAGLEGSTVKYLFITALMNQPTIHYWIIPGEVVDRVAFSRHQNEPDFVYALHIREDHSTFELEGTDVTPYHRQLHLSAGDAELLNRQFVHGKETKEKKEAKRAIASGLYDSRLTALAHGQLPESAFRIPLRGGRSAVLSVPVPTAEIDLQRIKGWIDLMSDVLTEVPPTEPTAIKRQVDAIQAIEQLQNRSSVSGNDQLSEEQIESEIRAARRERAR